MKATNILVYLLLYACSIYYTQVFKEEILIKNGNIELPGTLTKPSNSSKLIIWIHGSGNIDRNGNQAGLNINANYIQQFREEITKNGIAFFSYDKRTSNPKNNPFLNGITFDDLVSDAKLYVNYFKENKEFKEIILLGHSQGLLVAMLASKNVEKYISIAGPGEGIDQTIIKQITAQNAPLGEVTKAHVKELKETGTIKEVNPFLISMFSKQNHAFLSNWFQYNPVLEIKKISIPTLIISGSKDIQVKEEDATKLKEAKPDAQLKIIENMNHVLKTITKDSDNLTSYYSPDYTISEKLIQTIVEFVNK